MAVLVTVISITVTKLKALKASSSLFCFESKQEIRKRIFLHKAKNMAVLFATFVLY